MYTFPTYLFVNFCTKTFFLFIPKCTFIPSVYRNFILIVLQKGHFFNSHKLKIIEKHIRKTMEKLSKMVKCSTPLIPS